MPYRGYSYGRRYNTNRYNGAIISRLRSAHATLARSDHDYRGHRVRAMHAIRSAIRQLGHSSRGRFGYASRGFTNRNGVANRARMGKGRLSQAQSDALMRRALGTLQLVHSHMTSQGGTSRHARAAGYVQRAGQEITVGLSIR
jgi:hypothetical protein